MLQLLLVDGIRVIAQLDPRPELHGVLAVGLPLDGGAR
jgi:hypothetical protein